MSDTAKIATAGAAEEKQFTDVKDIERAIEAILFAAGYPVEYIKLSEVIGLPMREIKGLIEHMATQYDGRGIQLLM